MKKTLSFDFVDNEFIFTGNRPVEATGLDALMIWINKILRTEIMKFAVYDDTEYGVQLEDLIIGKNFDRDFAESELRREIESTLMKNTEIKGISDFNISAERDMLKVSFTVKTIYGESEVNL